MQRVFGDKQVSEAKEAWLSSDLIDELTEILVQETLAVQALIVEGERKQAALMDDDLVALEEAVATEMSLLQKLEQWEAHRLRHVSDIEKQLVNVVSPDGSNGLDLQQIAESIPGVRGQRLLDQGQKLKGLMLRLQDLNLTNSELLRHSMTLTNYCLSLLTGDTGHTIYGEPGKKERQGYQPGRLDARA